MLGPIGTTTAGGGVDTVRFADDRVIPRLHLDGVESGRQVTVSKTNPGNGDRLGVLATAAVGDGGRRRFGVTCRNASPERR